MSVVDFLVSILFGSLAVGAVQLARIVYGDGFAPLGLYLGATLSTLSLWHLKFASLVPISALVYFIILLSR